MACEKFYPIKNVGIAPFVKWYVMNIPADFGSFMNSAARCALILPAGFGIPASWRGGSDPSLPLSPHLSFFPSTALVPMCLLGLCWSAQRLSTVWMSSAVSTVPEGECVCVCGWCVCVCVCVCVCGVCVCVCVCVCVRVCWDLAWLSVFPKWGKVCMFGWGCSVGKSWGKVAQVQTLSMNDTNTRVSLSHTHTHTHRERLPFPVSDQRQSAQGRRKRAWQHHSHWAKSTCFAHTHMNDYRGGFFWLIPNTMRNVLSKACHCGSVTFVNTNLVTLFTTEFVSKQFHGIKQRSNRIGDANFIK